MEERVGWGEWEGTRANAQAEQASRSAAGRGCHHALPAAMYCPGLLSCCNLQCSTVCQYCSGLSSAAHCVCPGLKLLPRQPKNM